jgi:adenosine deaminase
VIDAALDNIKYMELRFTPRALSTIIKATPYDVIGWVCESVKQTCEEYDIEVRLIASMNRHESLEFGEQVLKAAIDHCDKGVVAIDLAGQEEGHPASVFRSLFREAKESGLGVTIHAGEWDGAMSVWDAIGNVGADRVGHGIRALEDPGVLAVLAERGVVLEVCPTSNVDSGAVTSLKTHPLPRLIDDGVITTINTDDPLVSNITLSDEMARAITYMSLTLDDMKRSVIRASQAAFLPDAERTQLSAKFSKLLYEQDAT